MNDLRGKIAFVTGASRGIGSATAQELANKGVKIVAVARSKQSLDKLVSHITKNGGEAHAIECDVSKYDELEKAIKVGLNTFGKLDILINNAGLIEPISKLAESQPNEWVKVADVNYKAVYYGTRIVLPYMLQQGGGTIINVSSGAASAPREGWSHYCSSKAASLMLTKVTHLEYGDQGIRVIGVSPGTVATNMQIAIRASGINAISQLSPDSHSPTERPAKLISWLCTDDAKEFDGDDVSIHDENIRLRAGVM